MKLIEYWGGPFQGMFLISLKAQKDMAKCRVLF